MKLKAIAGSGAAALAVAAVLVSGAGADVLATPSSQEFAEHPGKGFLSQCSGTTEEQNLNPTDALLEQLEAEGKCTSDWFELAPNELRVERELEAIGTAKLPPGVEIATRRPGPAGSTFYELHSADEGS
jgi:hypothetical protein